MEKGSCNSTSIIPITLSFLFLFIFSFQDVFSAPIKHLCHPEQRDALLDFKSEFDIRKPSSCDSCQLKTESWANNSDCCYWDGITCDAKSGEVMELNLACSCLHGQIRSNSKLFRVQNFRFLTTLDLSYNDFTGQIPSSIGNLSHLTTLQLYQNKFVGEIPFSFGSLKQLDSISVDDNMLSGRFPLSLLNLTKLSFLSLSNNHFTGTLPPNISSLSNLVLFDAVDNAFSGTLPSSLFTIPFLSQIYLSFNQFSGTLKFGNISSSSKLARLFLANNNFGGPIPRSISKFVNLETLAISHLNTQGPFDFSIFSHLKSLEILLISHLNTTTTIDLNAFLSVVKSLNYLDLSGNHVSGTNKSLFSDHPLQYLILSGCGITEFPELLRTQHKIKDLDISNNEIKGQVPGWLWTLPNLLDVNISNNIFSGFERLTKPRLSAVPESPISYLLGANNNFSGKIPSFICALRFLIALDLSQNNFSGSIPRCMVQSLPELEVLILSSNAFHGQIQKSRFSKLRIIDISHNHFNGTLPSDFLFNGSSIKSVNVGHNQLVGKLPRSLSSCSSLEVLNMEHNRLSDTFPFWLESLQNLQVLVLHSNEFHGSLQYHPKVASWFPQLRIIDISYNSFTGTLPSDFFMFWSAMYSEEDRSKLKYIGDKDNRYYQDSLVLMNKGVEMEYTRILTLLTAIDFSGNKLRGQIPKSIGLLKNLIVLNLSSNSFSGNIPSSLANLTELESLDLSYNKLSGQIPPSLGDLTSLSNVKVSHNQLVGPIPQGTQFQTQDTSSFEENLGLCGLPLSKKCGDMEQSQEPESEEEEDEEGVLSWTAAAIALAPGIIFGLTIGYLFPAGSCR